MEREVNHFSRFIRLSVFFLIPILTPFILYLILDPFMVIYPYKSYYESGKPSYVTLDRSYISTKTFQRYYPQYQYNSFILGNSRSRFYFVEDWKKHLAPDASCFHYDGHGESLYGIYHKVKYLDKKQVDIKNVLLVIDPSVFKRVEISDSHLGISSPIISDDINWYQFHLTFLQAYLTPNFLYAFADFTLNGKVKNYMKDEFLLNDIPQTYILKYNEIRFDSTELRINKGMFYAGDHLNIFYQRDSLTQEYEKVIEKPQKKMLREMAAIFEKHHTSLRILISPLYDQKTINTEDLVFLKQCFGSVNVFDFSGKNQFTESYQNYYETSHYRPHVARALIDSVYHSNNVTSALTAP